MKKEWTFPPNYKLYLTNTELEKEQGILHPGGKPGIEESGNSQAVDGLNMRRTKGVAALSCPLLSRQLASRSPHGDPTGKPLHAEGLKGCAVSRQEVGSGRDSTEGGRSAHIPVTPLNGRTAGRETSPRPVAASACRHSVKGVAPSQSHLQLFYILFISKPQICQLLRTSTAGQSVGKQLVGSEASVLSEPARARSDVSWVYGPWRFRPLPPCSFTGAGPFHSAPSPLPEVTEQQSVWLQERRPVLRAGFPKTWTAQLCPKSSTPPVPVRMTYVEGQCQGPLGGAKLSSDLPRAPITCLIIMGKVPAN